jgi:hypothetical protein
MPCRYTYCWAEVGGKSGERVPPPELRVTGSERKVSQGGRPEVSDSFLIERELSRGVGAVCEAEARRAVSTHHPHNINKRTTTHQVEVAVQTTTRRPGSIRLLSQGSIIVERY